MYIEAQLVTVIIIAILAYFTVINLIFYLIRNGHRNENY